MTWKMYAKNCTFQRSWNQHLVHLIFRSLRDRLWKPINASERKSAAENPTPSTGRCCGFCGDTFDAPRGGAGYGISSLHVIMVEWLERILLNVFLLCWQMQQQHHQQRSGSENAERNPSVHLSSSSEESDESESEDSPRAPQCAPS